jgi:hypothetical protein
MMNKKGVSLAGWVEGAVGVILILGCLAIIVLSMNISYNQSNDPTFGIASDTTKNALIGYQTTIQEGMKGDASTNQINGISLSTSWGMITAGLSIVGDFVTGQWIRNGIGLLGWGDAGTLLGIMLSLVFVLSLGFILLKILFKIKV